MYEDPEEPLEEREDRLGSVIVIWMGLTVLAAGIYFLLTRT